MTESSLQFWIILPMTILLCSYSLFTLCLTFLWWKIIVPKSLPININLKISIIIPVRNEVQNIKHLLTDIEKQTFPKQQFEVIVVDDSSTDGTRELVKQLAAHSNTTIRLIQLPDLLTTSPKKRAIETAIELATGELIITTDGDCRVGPEWIESFANYYSATNAKLISGPVTFTDEKSLTDQLQTVEFASLIGSGASAISAGYPSLCNGANLAYQRKAFFEVNGFEGVRHIASGDDEFLMHKIAATYPSGIHFIKDSRAIVFTKPHQKWSMFFRQRKRWASKWKHYQNKTPLALALYIFSCNFSLILSCVFFGYGIIDFSEISILWFLKCVPEWIFLGSALKFLNKSKSILFIPLTQIIYPFYVCFFGLAVQKPTYEWKGRKLK